MANSDCSMAFAAAGRCLNSDAVFQYSPASSHRRTSGWCSKKRRSGRRWVVLHPADVSAADTSSMSHTDLVGRTRRDVAAVGGMSRARTAPRRRRQGERNRHATQSGLAVTRLFLLHYLGSKRFCSRTCVRALCRASRSKTSRCVGLFERQVFADGARAASVAGAPGLWPA